MNFSYQLNSALHATWLQGRLGPFRRIAAVTAVLIGFAVVGLAIAMIVAFPVTGDDERSVSMPEITCLEFNSWGEADSIFQTLKPFSREKLALDTNSNGIPCEDSLPSDRFDLKEFEVSCDDFQHRDEAEYFYEIYGVPGENLFGLDRDLDGRPCEKVPPLDDTLRVLNRLNRIWRQNYGFGGDLNCRDFETWEDANHLFSLAGGPVSDPHRLDADKDGVPCESLPGAP